MAVRKCDADKFLSREEVERFVAVLRGERLALRVAFLLQLNLGLRVSEVLSIRCSDLSRGARSLKVRTAKRRQQTFHTLDVPRPLALLLSELRRRGCLYGDAGWLFPSTHNPRRHRTARGLQYHFRRVAKLAGIETGASTHALRHTRAMLIYRASGADVAAVAHDLRHADRRSAEAYVGVDLDRYAAATRRVPCFT